jgi:hypothetical protein
MNKRRERNEVRFRRLFLGLAVLAGACGAAFAQDLVRPASSVQFPFYVYREFPSRDNHYAPSGWMGDYRDISLNDRWRPFGTQSKTVIRVAYSAKGSQNNGWAGIYWQHPVNNWGNRPGGYNLNGAHKLVFKARGEKGGEMIEEVKVGGISGDYADSGTSGIGPVTLAKDWKQYEINLDGQELSNISGGFCWTVSRDHNPGGAVFYLDDIRYE